VEGAIMAESRDSRRRFTDTQKKQILYQQDNKCAVCHKKLDPRTVEFDHVKEWSATGETIVKNGAALHPDCHRLKTFNHVLKKTDKSKTEDKLATRQELNALTITQLKSLALKHKIKVTGRTYEDMWERRKLPPTKTQYINKLLGIVRVKSSK
jgi:hypothetical protein